jgi:hypothetical protein
VAVAVSTAPPAYGWLAVDRLFAVAMSRRTMNARLVLAQVPALPKLLGATRDGACKWFDLLVDVTLVE